MDKWQWIKAAIQDNFRDYDGAEEMYDKCDAIRARLKKTPYNKSPELWDEEMDGLDPTDIKVLSDVAGASRYCAACCAVDSECKNCELVKKINGHYYCMQEVVDVNEWIDDIKDHLEAKAERTNDYLHGGEPDV